MADDTDLDLSNPQPMQQPETAASRAVVNALWPEALTKEFWQYKQNPDYNPAQGNYKYGSQPGLSDAAFQGAAEGLGGVGVGGKAASTAAAAGKGLIPFLKGMIAGPKSATANMKAYHEAMGRLLQGPIHPETLYDKTGWFPRNAVGAGQLAYEIPDTGLNPLKLPLANKRMTDTGALVGPIDKFVSHPEAFKAYPHLRDYTMRLDPNLKYEGLHDSATKTISVRGDPGQKELNPEQMKLLPHELGHAIEAHEDWPRAPAPGVYNKQLLKLLAVRNPEVLKRAGFDDPVLNKFKSTMDELGRNRKELNAGKTGFMMNDVDPGSHMYWNHPSEVTQRNAANRFAWQKYGTLKDEYGRDILPNPTSKFVYPWSTEDVAPQKQFDYWKYLKNLK